ncbi:MAG: magnesium/cobalt transporter CorA [Candidatus Aenigmarchaeota archaeon]|nr:magnesium/cobalt transporter CorA [Candidatus Aenigmarchaeota archaeon]
MLKIAAFKRGKPVKNISVKKIRGLMSRSSMVWVDVERGSRKDFDFISKTFKLHPLTVEDMRNSNSLPKIDIVGKEYTMVIFHEVYYDRQVKKIRMSEVDFCIGKNFIITVHQVASASIESVRRKFMSGIYPDVSPDRVMHGVMDSEVEGYVTMMDQLDSEIEHLENRLLKGRTDGILGILSDHRREVTELRKIVGPQREIISKIYHGESPIVSEGMLFYFRDISDNMFRFYSSLESHRDAVTSAFETYTSIQSNNINKVLKQLSIISTVFLPMSFVAGIYGTNFQFVPGLSHSYGFYVMLLLLLVIGTGMYTYFKRKYK